MIRRNSVFKVMVALQAQQGLATVADLAARRRLDPLEIELWRRDFAQSTERWRRKSGVWLWSTQNGDFQ